MGGGNCSTCGSRLFACSRAPRGAARSDRGRYGTVRAVRDRVARRDIDSLLEQLPERRSAPIEHVRLHGMSISKVGNMKTEQVISLLAAGLVPQSRRAVLH